MSELTTTLATTINQAHADCMSCDQDLQDVVLRKCNKARECGLYLIEAKQAVGHGKWMDWMKENLTFSHDMASGYVRFAKANIAELRNLDEGVKSLYDAMIASGALEAPTGHGQQIATSSTWLDKATNIAQRICEAVNARIEKTGQQVEQWPADERLAFKNYLTPIVSIYERL